MLAADWLSGAAAAAAADARTRDGGALFARQWPFISVDGLFPLALLPTTTASWFVNSVVRVLVLIDDDDEFVV